MARVAYGLLVILISICVYVTTTRAGSSRDLPQPPVNIKTIVAGSLVIPMDTKQVLSTGNFNIKAYGLAVHLLYNDVPIYWSIRSGKQKDAKDFSATAQQVYPTTSGSSNQDYAGGPFIILKAYYDKALGLIGTWQSGNHGIRVDKITADTTADIRHEIFIKPKILISNLSQYSPTQTRILNAAGLESGTHYVIEGSSGAIKALSAASCYTFFSEPHYEWTGSAPAYYAALLDYVQSGGNFLAECAGAWSYENFDPASGRGGFQSIAGLYYLKTANQNLKYPNPDTPYNQFIGNFDGENSGHTPDYCFHPPTNIGTTQVDAATEASWLTNNAYYTVHNDPASAICTNGQTRLIASVSKPGRGQDLGGLVFYLGAHDWSYTEPKYDNGKRLYLNALITPAYRNKECGFDFCPPGQECPHDQCHTCVCSAGGEAVLTKIDGCCIQESDCGPCQSCLSNQCTDSCAGSATCSECDTQADKCVVVNCPCTTDDDCIPCYGCTTSGCELLSLGCCTSDSDCGKCGFCDFDHPITPARNNYAERFTKPFFICQSVPNCCEADSECGACQTCDTANNICRSSCTPCQTCEVTGQTHTCTDVDNCCLTDAACGDCEYCDLAASKCTACGGCTECNTDTKECDAKTDCCTDNDQCTGACEACTDNKCASTINGDLHSCCTSDSDCKTEGTTCASFSTCETSCKEDNDCGDCQTCTDSVCQDTAGCDDRGDGDGDGDGGSDAARATFGLRELF